MIVIQSKTNIRQHIFNCPRISCDNGVETSVQTPKIAVNKHNPTGSAEVSISLWLTEEEQEGLLNRVFSQQTLLHDRDRVLDALHLVDDTSQDQNDPGRVAEEQATEEVNWELSLVE